MSRTKRARDFITNASSRVTAFIHFLLLSLYFSRNSNESDVCILCVRNWREEYNYYSIVRVKRVSDDDDDGDNCTEIIISLCTVFFSNTITL